MSFPLPKTILSTVHFFEQEKIRFPRMSIMEHISSNDIYHYCCSLCGEILHIKVPYNIVDFPNLEKINWTIREKIRFSNSCKDHINSIQHQSIIKKKKNIL